ncbi:amidohydrolase [Nocardioides nitrophenolicus]|uniref:amidohydrolase n=1 Tax=Nocardioides nitrophenolicus TaxID=60489 RepID=UPI001EF9A10D|nr:amidohydrolase [Nocardioides nitrophenolicus]MBM7515940.1 hippurate hydrolase [Nocardioides nitrophenolicus]
MAIELDALIATYQDLHRHPELGRQEHRTAGIVAEQLTALGYAVTTGVGGTGVVGVLERGEGPTVLLRADMDALPVREDTGLAYASTATAVNDDGETVPVMHACGHDLHTTCLLGAAAALVDDEAWQGRLLLVFQPDEEGGGGAQAMVDDGLFERFGTPDVVLGQHVAPVPVGVLGVRSGPAFAASDALRITLYGSGGHGSRPEATVDPVVMGAALVQRLQTVVSREIAATDTVVVTVGSFHAGVAPNVIPDEAVLGLSIRTADERVRTSVLDAVGRMTRAEATAAGATREPEIEALTSFPPVVNDAVACDRLRDAFAAAGRWIVVDPGPVTGSEDVGILADAAGAPCAYWLLGGADPALFAGATTVEEIRALVADLPSNHSPRYAPLAGATLESGVAALVTAARSWLG